MGRPAKALSGFHRTVGSNPTLSAMNMRARYALAALIVASTLFVDAGNASARECANTYTARRNDSWWSIAAKSDITLRRILTLNKASMKTKILIGDDVCVSVANKQAADQPVADQPPAIKVATTSTRKEVEQIIRDIWPDDLEDRALAIAQRESNLKPHVIGGSAGCCYGLFQIFYFWHKDWLPNVGVTSAKQLLDPKLNARAAYELYQRNGWGPWKL